MYREDIKMGFFDKAEDGLMAAAEVIDGNKYLNSIKNAFTDFVPFIVVGSFGTLLNSIIASSTTGLAKWIPWLANLKPAFNAMSFATISCMTIPIVFLIAMHLAKLYDMPMFITGVLCVASYFTVVPSTVTVIIGQQSGTATGLGGGALGAQGLFIGMIVAVAVTEYLHLLMKVEKIKIKMPASVPKGIAVSFNILVPIFIVLITTAVFGNAFHLISGYYLNDFIYGVVQAPLESIVQTTPGIIIMAVACQLFWFLGIHGGLVVEPIRSPLSASALAANIAAVQAGELATQPLTRGFWTVFVVVGGAGLTLSLILSMLVFSKRDDHKVIAKLALLPGICGIGEPMVFGIPLVLNPIFALPFIINAVVSSGIALAAIKIGFIQCSIVDAPFGLPLFINATLSYGWHGAVVQLVILVIGFLVWTPFVLMSNRESEKKASKKLIQTMD
jgi:PTS system cellobiose-specific IIC component